MMPATTPPLLSDPNSASAVVAQIAEGNHLYDASNDAAAFKRSEFCICCRGANLLKCAGDPNHATGDVIY